MASPGRNSGESPGEGDWRRALRQAAPYMGLGLQIGGTMAAFALGGYLLDLWLGTLPWATIAGSAFGLIAVIVLLFRIAGAMDG